MLDKTKPMERCPEDVRLLKRYQQHCSAQRDEILELRAELYRAQAVLVSFKDVVVCLKAMDK
jgi:hypothetical protein